MSVDDSALYTGVDGEPNGVFGNEEVDKDTEKILQDQKQLVAELTPKLQSLIDMIDSEIELVMSIDRFSTATTQPEVDIRAELQAAALYKNYLGGLKTKFVLALNEVKK